MVQVQRCVVDVLKHLYRADALTDSRRAVFHIGNNLYSAKLVDLPCIIESQKTLDSKQMFKVADICQVAYISFVPICCRSQVYRCLSWRTQYLTRRSPHRRRPSTLTSSSGHTESLLHCTMSGNADSESVSVNECVLTMHLL